MNKYIAMVLTALLLVTFFGFFTVHVDAGEFPEKVRQFTPEGRYQCRQQAAKEFGWDEADKLGRKETAEYNQRLKEQHEERMKEWRKEKHERAVRQFKSLRHTSKLEAARMMGLDTPPVLSQITYRPVDRIYPLGYFTNCFDAHPEWTVEQWEGSLPSIRIRRR